MPRLENERCPEGGPGLQVTGAGPQGQRALTVPFRHYRAATCCALPRAVPRDYPVPAGHGGRGRVRTPNLKQDSDSPCSPHSHCPVPVPSSSPQPRHR